MIPNEHLRHHFISKNNFNVVKIDMPLSPLDKQNDNEFVGDTGKIKIIHIVNNSLYDKNMYVLNNCKSIIETFRVSVCVSMKSRSRKVSHLKLILLAGRKPQLYT